jgi:fumarate reductase flavoprotein subunit
MSNTWDVIIVGAGSAGIPAAIFAAQRGLKVLQIEADSRVGGTLYWSSGQISAAGTSVQRKLGIEDSPQAHYDDAQKITNNTIDPVLGRLAIDNAADTIEWLLECGYDMAPEAPESGVTHEPYDTRRYYWGPNLAISILDAVKPVHEKLVADGRIELKLQTRLTGLVTDDTGAVIGVEAQTPQGPAAYHANSVALTSGGYAANPDMWQEFTPDLPLCSYCNPYSRGDGMAAARTLGAKVDGEDKFLCTFAGWRDEPDNPLSGMFFGLAPTNRRPWEIYVDASGKRFVREDHPSIDHLENALKRQPGMKMFIIADEGIVQNAPPITPYPEAEFKARLGNHPNFPKAATLRELAEKIGVDAANLEDTVTRFNQAVDAGVDADFGREFLHRRIHKPPFYAMGASGITVVSPAGLNADGQLRVLGADGKPIPNLYAAGEVLGFTRLSGAAFVGGMSLTPAMTLGRLLGQSLLPG